jgi:hypothetical protein
MKLGSLIAVTLVLIVLGPLLLVEAANSNSSNTFGTETQTQNLTPQWATPIGIAITQDGKYAYLSFDTSCLIVKVYLPNLSIAGVTDLSDYHTTQCQLIALDATGTKIFTYSPTWQKIFVIDTQTMKIIHIIDNLAIITLVQSKYGHYLLAATGGGRVYRINTDTYEVTYHDDDNDIFFIRVKESSLDPNKWFVINYQSAEEVKVGVYDYKNKNWTFSVSIPMHFTLEQRENPFSLEILPNEQKLYMGTFGGWYPEFHSFGWLYSIDLTGKESIKTIPIDGGAMCLEASLDGKQLYIGTSWPLPNNQNIVILDTQNDTVLGQTDLGRNKFGGPYTQMNNLLLDPLNPHVLWAANTDGNSLLKINLENRTLADSLLFNDESFYPSYFVSRPQDSGYVLIRKSPMAFTLDLANATIKNTVELPMIRSDIGWYDIAIDNSGRMFIPQGESILEVNAQDLKIIKNHSLQPDAGGVWGFTLSNDQKHLYSIWQSGDGIADTFLAINTTSFKVDAKIKFGSGEHAFYSFYPFDLPNASKVYAAGGSENGPVVIKVIETNNFTVTKTITFNETGFLGQGGGPQYPFCYDDKSHTLYVGATYVILAINTDTDTIKQVIYLKDSANTMGLAPEYICYLNANSIALNQQENCLYIDHFDGCYMSIYNLTSNKFVTCISLKGLSPVYMVTNQDFTKIYCMMGMSDSITVVDVKSRTVEKVINLHNSIPTTTTTLKVTGFSKPYDISVTSNSSVSSLTFDPTTKQISFRSMGSSFAFSFPVFYNITFPNELLYGNFTLQAGSTVINQFAQENNGTHTMFSFTYDLQDAKNIQVTGTQAVPEFGFWALQLTAAVGTICAVVGLTFARRNKKVRNQTCESRRILNKTGSSLKSRR